MTGDKVEDRFGRGLRDLRISVTDRCNFRCPYCMPREVFGPDFAFLERQELLSFEEITRVVRVAATLGVVKVRLTGGEPLLRRGLANLVGMIAGVDGIRDIALTTNGSLLSAQSEGLRAAGLSRVTVSLDSLDDVGFKRMSDTNLPLSKVLDGIATAKEHFDTVKINTVIRPGVNDHEVEALAGWAREQGVIVRFIEFMDVGSTNGWQREQVVPSAEILRRITARWPATAAGAPGPGDAGSDVAERWAYDDGGGEFGVISSVTSPFCSTCVRARLSAVGELFTCLFARKGHDLRAVLRSGASDEQLQGTLAQIWGVREDRYSELRSLDTAAPSDPSRDRDSVHDGNDNDSPRVEMSYIGG